MLDLKKSQDSREQESETEELQNRVVVKGQKQSEFLMISEHFI